jgi:hypothetical protein
MAGRCQPRSCHTGQRSRGNRFVTWPNSAASAARAGRPLNGMDFGLRGDDRLLGTVQQPLRLGLGQTEIGGLADTVRPADLHHVRAPRFATSTQHCNLMIQITSSIPSQITDPEDAPLMPPPPILRQSHVYREVRIRSRTYGPARTRQHRPSSRDIQTADKSDRALSRTPPRLPPAMPLQRTFYVARPLANRSRR